jgi:hypothetical protein
MEMVACAAAPLLCIQSLMLGAQGGRLEKMKGEALQLRLMLASSFGMSASVQVPLNLKE